MFRHRSVLLSLDSVGEEATVAGPPAVRMDIMVSLQEAGIDKTDVEGIECQSKNKWYVVFKDGQTRNSNLNKEIELYEKTVKLAHPNPPRHSGAAGGPRYKYVKVFGYPLDSDAAILRKAMTYYGTISHIQDLIDQRLNIKTGVRNIAFTSLDHEIPSFVYVGKHLVRCNYEGQTKTCRRCHQPGHLAKDCDAGDVCRECGQAGHKKNNCPNRRCYHCQEKGHLEFDCPEYAAEYPEPEAANADNVHEDNDTGKEDAEIPKLPDSLPDWDKPSEPLPNAWGTMPTQHSTETDAQPTTSTVPDEPISAPDITSDTTLAAETPTVPDVPTAISTTVPNPPFLKPSSTVKSATKSTTSAPSSKSRARESDESLTTDDETTPTPTDDEEMTLRGQKRTTNQSSPKKSKTKKSKRHPVLHSQAKVRNPFMK